MGWLFSHKSKEQLIKDLTATEEDDKRKITVIRRAVRKNVLWTVSEIRYKNPVLIDGTKTRLKTVIECHLLEQDNSGLWGYKSLRELEGPCYYTCPISYLRLAPETNPEWRNKVWAWHIAHKY